VIEAHRIDPRLHRVLAEQIPRSGRLENAEAFNRVTYALFRACLEGHSDELRIVDLEPDAFVCVTSIEALAHTAVLHRSERFSGEAVGRLVDEATRLVTGYREGKGNRASERRHYETQAPTVYGSAVAAKPSAKTKSLVDILKKSRPWLALTLYATPTLRDALNRTWRRPGDQRCEPPQILSDGGQNKFILGASGATQSKPAELQDALEVREPHLDVLALTSRTSVGFQRDANSRGITAPTASHNGRNVALAVPTRLFLSLSPPSLERVSHPRLPQAP